MKTTKFLSVISSVLLVSLLTNCSKESDLPVVKERTKANPSDVQYYIPGVVVVSGIWDGDMEGDCCGCLDDPSICYIEIIGSALSYPPGIYFNDYLDETVWQLAGAVVTDTVRTEGDLEVCFNPGNAPVDLEMDVETFYSALEGP